MQLPEAFLEQLPALIGYDEAAFLQALQEEAPVSIRLNHHKVGGDLDFQQVHWHPQGYYLKERPIFTLDPAFHGGAYYVQEASSMFLHHLMKKALELIDSEQSMVLDLCAAPGGKSTLLASILKDAGGYVVANEIIHKRSLILAENAMKWGTDNLFVANSRPEDFVNSGLQFDIIVVDAPCSGEGMFRKDPQALQEWSTGHVKGCRTRQQDILEAIWPCLKPGGVIIYSTCTYNQDENEGMMSALQGHHELEFVQPAIPEDWNVVNSQPGYRFWPDKVNGEGFYMAMAQKHEGSDESPARIHRSKKATQKQVKSTELIEWINGDHVWFTHPKTNIIKALPTGAAYLKDVGLNWKFCGLPVAVESRKGWIPEHALALSTALNREVFEEISLSHEQALDYLSGAALQLSGKHSGWCLLTYNDLPVGFAKGVGNRLNNNYPKHLRIRMDWKKHANTLQIHLILRNLKVDQSA